MELHKLLAIINAFALCVNVGIGIFGITVLLKARKLNKELREYINNLKK